MRKENIGKFWKPPASKNFFRDPSTLQHRAYGIQQTLHSHSPDGATEYSTTTTIRVTRLCTPVWQCDNFHKSALLMMVFLNTSEAAWYIISVVSVCLSFQTITFEWRRKFIFAHPVYLQQIWIKFVGLYEGHRVNLQGYRSTKGRKCVLPTAIGHNSASIKHRAMKFGCSIGFLHTADGRIEWCDRHLCHVTGSDHD